MTMILAQASRLFGLTVSDRLVTKAAKPYDRVSNKSVLLLTRDAVIAMGYTGLAYIDSTPTDQWITEVLIGQQFERHQRPPSLRMGSRSHTRYIGPALRLLSDRLTHAFQNDRRPDALRNMFEILGVGWQWNRKGITRPVMFGIEKPKGQREAKIWRAPRQFGRDFRLGATPEGLLTSSDLDTMRLGLKAICSVDEAEQVFVETIRTVAQRPPCVVGPDCMSILLPPPNLFRWVRVRYIASSIARLAIQSRTDGAIVHTAACAFSPWIVSENLVHSPSLLAGSFKLEVGPFEVQLEAPEAIGPGLQGAMGSQKRPPERVL